mgnify:FL=1|tara:strand:+ start:978 stop:1778 length:801 start_codon:yes stop_codon:yes gene_type:complete
MKARDYVHRNFGGQCSSGDIAPYVIVTGSKSRTMEIASNFDEYKQVADDYEYLICTGSLNGYPITACSTGIGGMSVSIAIEELANLGAKTILRIGVTGPIQNEFNYADLIIAKGAVRWDGTSHDYAMPEYPAIAHFEVFMASILSAKELGYPYKTGIIADLASLGPLSNDGYRSFLSNNTKIMHDQLMNAGVLNGTGEASTMLVQSSIYNIRSGVINISLQDSTSQTWNTKEDYRVVNCGIKTISILQKWDKQNSQKNIKHTVPSI